MNPTTSRLVINRSRRRRRIFELVARKKVQEERDRALPGPPRCLRDQLERQDEVSR